MNDFGPYRPSCFVVIVVKALFLHVFVVMLFRFCSLITEPPSPPTGPLEVKYNDATSLRLSWHSPKIRGGYPLNKYKVQMKEESSKDWRSCGQSAEETILVTKLKEDKKYLFRVVACNKQGDSEPLETKEYMSTQSFMGMLHIYSHLLLIIHLCF